MLLFLLFEVSAFSDLKLDTEPSFQALACSKYVCDPTIGLNPNTCIYYGGQAYYLQTCVNSPNTYCPPVFNLLNQTCTVPVDPNYQIAYPGESCQSNSWCKYGSCQDYVCYAQEFGANCASHGECNPGLRCASGKCIPQLQIGQTGCLNDNDCVNNAGCDVNVCIGYYSVTNNNWVNQCQNSMSQMCQSGFCLYGYCLPPVKSSQKVPQGCFSNSDCVSHDLTSQGITLYTTCQCGYSHEGYSYCTLFPGDAPYQDLQKIYQKWISSKNALRCNTMRRWSTGCVATQWGDSLAEEFDYYTYRANYYPQVQELDSCTLDILNPVYSAEQNSMNSHAMIIFIGLSFLGFIL